jgi:multicomponent Na+:H+ antiporter subunit G
VIADIASYGAGVLVVLGALFCLTAAIGLVRLPDLYTRMHAASKAGLLGAGLILLSLAVVSLEGSVVLRSMIGIGFLALTTPVAAHLLARAALRLETGNETDQTIETLLSSTEKSQ